MKGVGQMELDTVSLGDLKGARLKIEYNEIDINSKRNTFDSHTHNECEIYINLTGDVSFVVENTVYPIVPGSMIITRPGEYHHCVYHSDALHSHFWILFSADRMSEVFSRFYERPLGKDNMLMLSGSGFKELISLCHDLRDRRTSPDEEIYRFFHLIHLINGADVFRVQFDKDAPTMDRALDFIRKNLSEPILIRDIADAAYVSVNTLGRHFYKNFQVSPSEYLKKRRLANAAELLKSGASVTDACQGSGFVDCSKFIRLFKKHYGMTPLRWKKSFSSLEE